MPLIKPFIKKLLETPAIENGIESGGEYIDWKEVAKALVVESDLQEVNQNLDKQPAPETPQGTKCACGHLDIPEVEDSDEMLSDMQLQLEGAQADVRILKEVQGLDEALIQDLKKQIELYKQRDHHHYYLVDEANNKIADLETSRNNLRHRGDLYQEWYREILQKYTAERERTWWSRLCN